MTAPGFLPYARHSFGEEEAAAAARVVLEGPVSQGPAIAEFEERAAARCGARFATAVSSGTAALHLSFLALELAPGDEVVVPALTFVATANAVLLAGGTPVVADIDPLDLNLSVQSVRARLSPRTRAICPVHFAGVAADLKALWSLAAPRGIVLVEDAAHALGAETQDPELGWYRIGRPARSRAVAFSLHPAKSISTGEGGLVLTDDPELDRRLRELRHHGLVLDPARPADQPSAGARLERPGLNYRLGDVAAAIGSVQLAKLDRFLARRAEIAARYRGRLAGLPGLRLPHERQGTRSAHNLFIVRIDGGAPARDRVLRLLHAGGIGAGVHYRPLARHPYYQRRLGWRPEDCPAAETCAGEVLTLPLFPGMTDGDADRVIAEVRRALEITRDSA